LVRGPLTTPAPTVIVMCLVKLPRAEAGETGESAQRAHNPPRVLRAVRPQALEPPRRDEWESDMVGPSGTHRHSIGSTQSKKRARPFGQTPFLSRSFRAACNVAGIMA